MCRLRNTLTSLAGTMLLMGVIFIGFGLTTSPASHAQVSPRTRAVFRDQTYTDSSGTILVGSDRLRSDGKGAYVNSTDCVYASVSNVSQGGSFFMRTVSRNCKTLNPRSIVLDLSEFAPTNGSTGSTFCSNAPRAQGVCQDVDSYGNVLNLCGPNTIPDASFNVTSLFRTAPGAPLSVEVLFNLQEDYAKQRAYKLAYNDATVSDASLSNVRVFKGGLATLMKIVPKSTLYPEGLECLGEYNMPFELTVTK